MHSTSSSLQEIQKKNKNPRGLLNITELFQHVLAWFQDVSMHHLPICSSFTPLSRLAVEGSRFQAMQFLSHLWIYTVWCLKSVPHDAQWSLTLKVLDRPATKWYKSFWIPCAHLPIKAPRQDRLEFCFMLSIFDFAGYKLKQSKTAKLRLGQATTTSSTSHWWTCCNSIVKHSLQKVQKAQVRYLHLQ